MLGLHNFPILIKDSMLLDKLWYLKKKSGSLKLKNSKSRLGVSGHVDWVSPSDENVCRIHYIRTASHPNVYVDVDSK